MDNKSNPLDGLGYRLVDDIEGNSFRLENNKGESLQLNLPDGLQFGEQITIPKAIKANERKHMKINIAENEIVTPRTAYSHIQKLVKNGLLTQTSMKGDGVYKVNWKGMYEFCGATFIFEEGEDR